MRTRPPSRVAQPPRSRGFSNDAIGMLSPGCLTSLVVPCSFRVPVGWSGPSRPWSRRAGPASETTPGSTNRAQLAGRGHPPVGTKHRLEVVQVRQLPRRPATHAGGQPGSRRSRPPPAPRPRSRRPRSSWPWGRRCLVLRVAGRSPCCPQRPRRRHWGWRMRSPHTSRARRSARAPKRDLPVPWDIGKPAGGIAQTG